MRNNLLNILKDAYTDMHGCRKKLCDADAYRYDKAVVRPLPKSKCPMAISRAPLWNSRKLIIYKCKTILMHRHFIIENSSYNEGALLAEVTGSFRLRYLIVKVHIRIQLVTIADSVWAYLSMLWESCRWLPNYLWFPRVFTDSYFVYLINLKPPTSVT